MASGRNTSGERQGYGPGHSRDRSKFKLAGCFILLASAVPGGCASVPVAATASADPGGNAGGYQLVANTPGVDCKKLTGQMQVRILELRGEPLEETSAVSQAMKSVLGALNGVSFKTKSAAQDVAKLEADNQSLATAGCPSFDLKKELSAGKSTPTPLPTIAPAKK